MKKSIVFDMDGVIFDSETLCLRTWSVFSEQYGMIDVEKEFQECIGGNRSLAIGVLKKWQGEDFPCEEFLNTASTEFHRIVKEEGIPMKTGVRELLSMLKNEEYRIALASSTKTETVISELKLAGLDSFFRVIVGGDQVQKSKPEPDIYLYACEKLGVDPRETYAVEDSHNGVRSAARAGMQVLMVPDRLAPTEEMEALAAGIFTDLHAVKEYLTSQDKRDRRG